ncbi:ATP synthase gamma chain [Streptomyces hirsutus]
MGAQLRVYKRRIRSVTATKKITKAMEMIAASRVVKAQRKVRSSTPYAEELTRAVTAVGTGSDAKHPLTTEAENPTRVAVLLLTSDRGLAGAFNANAIKAAEQLTERLEREGKEVDTYIVGRRGLAHYNFRERMVVESFTGFTDEPSYADAKKVAAPLIEAIEKETADGGVDELHIVYTEFVSMMTQAAVGSRMLPLRLDEVVEEGTSTKDEILLAVRLRALGGGRPRRPAAALRGEPRLQRAAPVGRFEARRHAARDEVGHRQRGRADQHALPSCQRGPPGRNHPGNQRDRRWRRRSGRRKRGE